MNFAEYENCTQCFKKLKVFKYDFGLLFEDELGAGTLPVLITNEDAVNEYKLSILHLHVKLFIF